MKRILGIDVGGTKIAAGLVDEHFRVTKVQVLSTSQTNLLGQIVKIINSYQGFTAIGIGIPGRVADSGFVDYLPNVKHFKSINLKFFLGSKFKQPVHVMNDTLAFALAESRLGAGKGVTDMVGVIMGTGLGSGLVKDRQVSALQYTQGKSLSRMAYGKSTLEQAMQRASQSPQELKPVIDRILDLIAQYPNPKLIVFGGGHMKLPGVKKIIAQTAKRKRLKVGISKLKNAGIIGAVLPLLKK